VDLALLYCDTRGMERGTAADGLPDHDPDAVAPIVSHLRGLGHAVRPLGVTFASLEDLPDLLRGCDAVFNICDGTGADGTVGPGAPALLQQMGVPFTGCSVDPYVLSIDKARTRDVLHAAGVLVPEGRVFASEEHLGGFAPPWPVIVKPREGFGSLGIDHRSVVHDAARLGAAVRRARRAGDGDVLVERYLPGREFSVGLVGAPEAPLVIPAIEFRFGAGFAEVPAVRTLRSKHDPTSPEYEDVDVVKPGLDTEAREEVERVAVAAWRALGCDGYGRVDLRLDEQGRPVVIDVNANCSLEIGPLDPDCGTIVRAARLAGMDDAVLLEAVLQAGLARGQRGTPPVKVAASGRWNAKRGHSLHALRSLEEGEVIAELDNTLLAGRGTRRQWNVEGVWLVPDPPVRWARAAVPSRANAHLSRHGSRRVVSVARAVPQWAEVRVAGRPCGRGAVMDLQASVRLASP
jgi:D-alanine-D-alanine ligase